MNEHGSRRRGRGLRSAAALAAALCAAAILAAAFGGRTAAADTSASPSPAASSAAMVRIGEVQAPDTLNPFVGYQGIDYQIWHLNYDYLVGFDAATQAPCPELAQSWETSADGKTWTFHVRNDVKWQDGVPFTAGDVAFTFNYIIKNDLSNVAVYTDGITGAKAIDDTTVEIYTKAPKSNMLAMGVSIIPEHIWSKISGKAAGSTFQNPPPIVGTGPYQVVDWKKGSYVHLKANPDYWKGAPKVQDLYLMTYTNPDTMTQDLKLGTIQAAVNVPFAQFSALQNEPNIQVNKGASWQFIEVGINCYDSPDSKGNPVLRDPVFRQALNWAVDRDKFIATALDGYAQKGQSLIVPYSPFHWEPAAEQMYTYDPEKAKQLLEDAGYKDVDGDGYRETKDGKPITLNFEATTDSPENATGGKLCVQWWKDIGVRVKFSVVDAGVLMDQQYSWTGSKYTPDFDMFIWYWTQDVDPSFMISIYTPAQLGMWSDCGWIDDAYTKLSDEQATTIDRAQRIPLVQQAQQIFHQAAPYVIMCYPYQLEAWRTDKWEGWTKAPTADGSAVYNYNNIDTYLNLTPKAGATSTGSGGAKGAWIAIGAVVVVVVALVAWALLRRRDRAVEE